MINDNEILFDLIFMDIDMPVMDGMEATKMIRKKIEQMNKRNKTRIVFCSAFESEEQKKICLSIGGDDYVMKPITREKIK